jgi:hypothetical protein
VERSTTLKVRFLRHCSTCSTPLWGKQGGAEQTDPVGLLRLDRSTAAANGI